MFDTFFGKKVQNTEWKWFKTPKMILTNHGSSKKIVDIYIVPISMLGL